MIELKAAIGRPRKEIKWDEFDKLCVMLCTETEIAAWFGCSVDTLENRCKEEKGILFSEYYKEKREQGKISLRRKQWQLADKSAAMAIFLGKNNLGQKDVQELDHSGSIAMSPMTEEQINAELAKIVQRTDVPRTREGGGTIQAEGTVTGEHDMDTPSETA